MAKYVLISFYSVHRYCGSQEKEVWLVNGHVHGGHVNELGEFGTRCEAIDHCFQFGVPVMQGSQCSYIAEKLAG